MADGTTTEKEALLLEDGDGTAARRVLPSSLVEVAELIGCSLDDLTQLRYGNSGMMFMSRSRQLDRASVPNRKAVLVAARFHQLPVFPKGAVVCFPHGVPWAAASGPSGATVEA